MRRSFTAFRAAAAAALLATLLAAAAPARAPLPTWKNGPPFGGDYFPIAVWLQEPSLAPRYKAAGINLYIGLWKGPTDEQLATLKAAGMPVVCEQTAVGLAHRDDRTIVGWMHGDEPDNAQPVRDPATGRTTYGPFIPPEKIVAEYDAMRAQDPTRPVMLNLGQGVANDHWVGRGNGAKLSDYETYVKGGDIISFDVYPVAGLGAEGSNLLWYVPKGVDRLMHWTGGQRRVWDCIECTNIGGEGRATPAQVRSEVWMSLIHGSTGLIYFVHQFKPREDDHALLDDPEMLAAVTGINRQIHDLAPVLNSPTLPDAVEITSSSETVPVDGMVKRHGGATYLFTVAMRNGAAKAGFHLPALRGAHTAEVIGENRSLPVRDGRFDDNFAPYQVHLYRIR